MPVCNVYINECSAEGQMHNTESVEHAIMCMIDSLSIIDGCSEATM